jgi:hypothetical protein
VGIDADVVAVELVGSLLGVSVNHADVATGATYESLQESAVFVPVVASATSTVPVQLLLHMGPCLVIDDSLVLTLVDLAAIFDPARIDDVGQQVVEPVLSEAFAARSAPGAGGPRLRQPAAVIEFLDHRDQRPVFNIECKDLDDASRLLMVEHE